MGAIRKVLLVGVGVLALHGASACTSDTELNPQPLPPDQGGGEGVPARTPAESESESGDPKAPGGSGTAGGTSSGSSGTDGTTSGGTNPLPPDAGAGDAGGRD